MMKKLLAMTVLLAAMLALSACGGAGQESPPPEPTQAESEAPANGEEAQPEEGASEETAPSEDAPEQGVSSEAPSGPSATTMQGEEVSLGEGGEVTALFFMAGW